MKKSPQLRAVVFDLKNVIPITKEKIREAGLEDRVTFVEGDFYKDPLPAGCDLALCQISARPIVQVGFAEDQGAIAHIAQ